GPAAVVGRISIALAEEGTVAAVIGFDVGDVRIGGNAANRFRLHADEGIVCGVDDEGRDRDALDHVGGCGARVVVVGPGKSEIEGGDAVVEHAQAGNAAQARYVELSGEEARFEA